MWSTPQIHKKSRQLRTESLAHWREWSPRAGPTCGAWGVRAGGRWEEEQAGAAQPGGGLQVLRSASRGTAGAGSLGEGAGAQRAGIRDFQGPGGQGQVGCAQVRRSAWRESRPPWAGVEATEGSSGVAVVWAGTGAWAVQAALWLVSSGFALTTAEEAMGLCGFWLGMVWLWSR